MINFYSNINDAVSKQNLKQEHDQGDKVAVYYDDLYDLHEQLSVLKDVVERTCYADEILAELYRRTNRDLNKIICKTT